MKIISGQKSCYCRRSLEEKLSLQMNSGGGKVAVMLTYVTVIGTVKQVMVLVFNLATHV